MTEIVKRPTPPRLRKASDKLNVLRENNRNVRNAHRFGDEEAARKYVPDFASTIDEMVKLFRECFGTTKAEHRSPTTFSKLAHAHITEDDIGFKRMFNCRSELVKYVKEVIKKDELWAVPPSFEGEDEEDEAMGDMVDSDAESSDDDDAGADSDSDDDADLRAKARRCKERVFNRWLDALQPAKNQSSDEYAEQIMFLAERGVNASQTRGRATRSAAADDDNVQVPLDPAVGLAARKRYEMYFPDRKEKKPTKILRHHDAGPRRGRQYEVKWSNVGYGAPTTKWKGKDYVLMWPDLLENYDKVWFSIVRVVICERLVV